MATPEDNKNCHYMQHDPHKCKIKTEKFILICCGVTKLLRKVSQRGGIRRRPPPNVRWGLNSVLYNMGLV